MLKQSLYGHPRRAENAPSLLACRKVRKEIECLLVLVRKYAQFRSDEVLARITRHLQNAFPDIDRAVNAIWDEPSSPDSSSSPSVEGTALRGSSE